MYRKRFEELPVWESAVQLAQGVFDLTRSGVLREHPGLRDQLERAALSVSNNIAEGWERGTHEELLTFLYYARGSCREVRSMLHVLCRWNAPDLARTASGLLDLALDTSRQLGAWLESLKNSDGKGPRYRNDAARATESERARQAAFLARLREIQDRSRLNPTHEPD